MDEGDWQAAARLAERLAAALGPMEAARDGGGEVSAAEMTVLLRDALAAAASDDTGADALAAAMPAETALRAILDGLAENGTLTLPPADYPFFLAAVMGDASVSRPLSADPRIHIWGALEARLQSVDLMVLAGLDEGVWPAETRTDPFLSRAMRSAVGLLPPERRLGLAAHDFSEGMAAARVIVARAEKRGGTPTVESRWLQRLSALIGKDETEALAARGARYLEIARALDRPSSAIQPAARPEPRPPVAVRPRHLSITEIETLIRDPYAVYAKHVLKLEPLDTLGNPPDAALRGSIIHAALARFTEEWTGAYDAAAEARLLAIGADCLKEIDDFPEVQAVWAIRFAAIARWFVAWEAERNATVARRHAEIAGKLELKTPGGIFTLTGRADRIDEMADGRLAIYDFKTGTPQTERTVFAGLTPQMTLEAAMARAGGFPNIPAGSSVGDLAWLSVGKAGRGEPYVSAVHRNETADDLAERALRRIAEADRGIRPGNEALSVAGAADDGQCPLWRRLRPSGQGARMGAGRGRGRGRMSAPPNIDPTTLKAQADASNPLSSAWVSANAGSGKTFVLSRRVIRLLLAGTDPGRILCLTFTKAAAALMAARVFETLAAWTKMDDAELAQELAALEGRPPDARLLASARRLFARALETPGGLKIQTIHAFCERLLHQFPFEANVAGHFEVLDERDTTALTTQARHAVLARTAAEPNGILGRALETVLSVASDMAHEEAIAEFIDKRDRIGALDRHRRQSRPCNSRSPPAARPEARRDGRELPQRDPRRGAARYACGERGWWRCCGRRQDRRGLRPTGWHLTSRPARTTNGATRGSPSDFSPRRRGCAQASWSPRRSSAEEMAGPRHDARRGDQERLTTLLDRIATAELFESTAAMLRLSDAAIGEYAKLKQRRGVLDFEDLVVKTVTLLSRSDAAHWVQYKLDRGLDHILVDEAQDTSPRQWQVIRSLVEEFFAGAGASETLRTIFAVGDEKQSIFSFQGAVPAWFSRMQRALGDAARDSGGTWFDRKLHLSFRSVPVVLEAVDAVFKSPAAHAGLSAEAEPPQHDARRKGEPGRVVIWPAIAPPEKPEAQDWATPLDTLGADSPEVQLAKRIASTIRDWLDRGETLDAPDKEGRPRPIRAGEILILTRSRGALTDAINRELKTEGVPIAGTDRLMLTEHIAVMDLMALGRVVLLPEDDLSLAALLKSPLIGLSEEALFDLAHGRDGSLWDALGEKARTDEAFARARGLIEQWLAMADRRDPHAFYARILGTGRGRAAFLARLGPEAEDVLDEFLAQALAYEQANVATLEGFLAWLMEGETEIRRDTETLRDEVRVMTVHGAKGLEADVVFLVDNGTQPSIASHDPRLLSLGDDDNPLDPGPFVWMRSARQMPDAVRTRLERERDKGKEEYRRLLYVGMTRARDRLYVAGLAKRTPEDDRRWHALVSDALEADCVRTKDADGEEILEWRPPDAVPDAIGRRKAGETAPALPDWATRNAPPPPPPLAHVTPSSVFDAEETAAEPAHGDGSARADALMRGRLVHRLLESLPAIATDRRKAVGAAYLAAFAKDMDEAARAALLEEVMAVMDDPAFAAVFAEGSRAEVEIAGRITRASGEAAVAGRVDRLAVTAERVLIVDYKTDRPAPERLEDVPTAYATQLALYRTILRRLYPGRAVAAALLWTDRPALMEIPSAALDSAESRAFEG